MSRVAYSRSGRVHRGRSTSASHSGSDWQPHPVNRTFDELPTQGQRRGLVESQASRGASATATQDCRVPAGQSTSEPRSLQSHGSHYVLPPDPQKNAKLKRTAEEEMEDWERHKTERREQTARLLDQQTPAALGGHRRSREDIDRMRKEQERKQLMDARFAKVRQREKREDYHRLKREREEEELQKMKQVQREKGRRQKAREEGLRQSQMDEMRRKRLEKFEPNKR